MVRSSRSHEQKIDNNHVPFHVLSYNCGGLSTIKDELFTWISDANLHAVFLQETWMLGELDYESRGWLCVNSGLKEARRAHAGVMTLVRADFVDRDTLRFHHVIPGHLLHVQVRSKGGWLSLLNIYQFCWERETEDQAVMKKRTPVWQALRDTLGHIPSTHFLMIGGDMNTVTKPQAPRLGTGMLKDKVPSPDAEAMIDIMLDFDLIASNTFGRMQTYTYIHAGYQQARKSFVDYILTRRSGGAPNKVTHLRQFPVARWRQGGRHLPVRVHFTLSPYKKNQSAQQAAWPGWKRQALCKLLKENGEIRMQYSMKVEQALQQTHTQYDPTDLNKILLRVADETFQLRRPSSRPPQWAQQPHVMSVKNMWAAYRQMKAQSRNMRGIIQAWRKHKEFMQMHKALQKQSRRLRRVRMDDIIKEAEDGTDPRNENIHGLFTLIKRIAPKQVKKRTQLRAESGRLLEPAEEATELANYWKSVNGSTCGHHNTFSRQDWPAIGPCMHFSRDEIQGALRALQGSKAAPPHLAPHALWKAAAKPVADFVAEVVGTSWATQGTFIPVEWAAS